MAADCTFLSEWAQTEWKRQVREAERLAAAGRRRPALRACEKSLHVYGRLSRSGHGADLNRKNVAVMFVRIGDALHSLREFGAAREAYRESLDLMCRLPSPAPDPVGAARDMSVVLERYADALVGVGRPHAAVRFYARSERLARDVLEEGRAADECLLALALIQVKVGDVRSGLREHIAANAAYRTALDIVSGVTTAVQAGGGSSARLVGLIYERLGDVRLSLGDREAALDAARTSLAWRLRLVEAAPDDGEFARDLALGLVRAGDERAANRDPAGARRAYAQAQTILNRLARLDADNARRKRDLWVCHWRLARQSDDPVEHWRAVVRLLREIGEDAGLSTDDERYLRTAAGQLGRFDGKMAETRDEAVPPILVRDTVYSAAARALDYEREERAA